MSKEWDVALSALEGRKTTLAADMLLDALCLDSQAGAFLEERADLLFANNGVWLNRLLLRFLHIATVPSTPPVVRDIDRSLALYLDAHYRTPVYGLWPAIANFLYRHIEKAADLISPTVAKVCETWLTTTPHEIQAGVLMPYRRELAAVALPRRGRFRSIKEKVLYGLRPGPNQSIPRRWQELQTFQTKQRLGRLK
jgi:hypothetical protein